MCKMFALVPYFFFLAGPLQASGQLCHNFLVAMLSCRCIFLLQNTHSPYASTCTLYQPIRHRTRCGSPQTNNVDYIQNLTGLKVSELVEITQDRETWCELVVAVIDPQPRN